MYQYKGQEDTIVAPATPAGTGGIALLRLSGPEALKIALRIFMPAARVLSEDWLSHTVRFGRIMDSAGQVIDEVLVTYMRGPRSYTAEDVVEIGCHGGAVAVRAVLERCLEAGARLAAPGEFTKRAFLNGRIDLAQAEAVQDIISARTEASLRSAARQLKGELSLCLGRIREQLLDVLAGIEALLNFPEEATDLGQAVELSGRLVAVRADIDQLLATAHTGCVLREGLRVVIAGKPNVGKSSLLNALLRQPRAIVTDLAGTTRDILEETANIAGFPVNFVDTAGILDPRDAAEAEAVRRSRESFDTADAVILVLDHSRALEGVDRELMQRLCSNRHLIVALNKADLPAAFSPAEIESILPVPVCGLSARSGDGLKQLEERVAAIATRGLSGTAAGAMLTQARHIEALTRARASLDQAVRAVSDGVPFEIVCEQVRAGMERLDAVTGRDCGMDVIDRIFSSFCIGK